jgi:hypothetical protein
MAEKLRRPGPYTPLSATFHTGRTGTAILEKFGLAGLGVWAAMLAAAKAEEGMIIFRHEDDWGAIGLAAHPPEFELKTFLTYLGRRKQTRTTRQGRVMYVELTRWTDWTKQKDREESAWRMSRKRAESKRNTVRTVNELEPNENERSPARAREELELDIEIPKAVTLEEYVEQRPEDFTTDQNGIDPFGLARRFVENAGWQDPHLEDELHERWPELQPEQVADLLGRAVEVGQEVA